MVCRATARSHAPKVGVAVVALCQLAPRSKRRDQLPVVEERQVAMANWECECLVHARLISGHEPLSLS